MKHMKRFCIWPFFNVWIKQKGTVSICCRMKNGGIVDGNLNEMDFESIVNSDTAKEMRKSILDGTYKFCKNDCPLLYAEYDLNNDNTVKRIVSENRVELRSLEGVQQIILAYDNSCPLKCPSCRTEVLYAKGEELKELQKYHDLVLEKIPTPKFLNVAGSGDALGSYIIKNFLQRFHTYDKFCRTKIIISTNGVLLSPGVWESIQACHANIDLISVSIDGASQEVYTKTRTGNFKIVKHNMDYIASVKEKYSFRLQVNFIVQKNNFMEMGDMVELCRSWNVDSLIFMPIRHWPNGVYSKEEINSQRIFDPPHPLFKDFLEILKDGRLDDSIVTLSYPLSDLKNINKGTKIILIEMNRTLLQYENKLSQRFIKKILPSSIHNCKQILKKILIKIGIFDIAKFVFSGNKKK